MPPKKCHHTEGQAPANIRRPERTTEPISPPTPASTTRRIGNTNRTSVDPDWSPGAVAVIAASPDVADVSCASAKNVPFGIDSVDGFAVPIDEVSLTSTLSSLPPAP